MQMRKPEDLHETESSRRRVIGSDDEENTFLFWYRKTGCGIFAAAFLLSAAWLIKRNKSSCILKIKYDYAPGH